MYCAMRLRFQSLCGRITTRSLWDNCAIRLDHTSSCLSLAAQAKLLDLISVMGKKFEAPKKSSYSNDELLRMRNKDMNSLLDIFEPVCDDNGCQCEHHKKIVELMQKSKEIKNACHHKVAAWQTVSEGSNIKFEIWKERMVITETADMRFCSQFLSEDLSFGADSQSSIVGDRLNTIDSASEIVSMNHNNKLKIHLKKEHIIKWWSIGSTVRPARTIFQSPHHCFPKLRTFSTMPISDCSTGYHQIKEDFLFLYRRGPSEPLLFFYEIHDPNIGSNEFCLRHGFTKAAYRENKMESTFTKALVMCWTQSNGSKKQLNTLFQKNEFLSVPQVLKMRYLYEWGQKIFVAFDSVDLLLVNVFRIQMSYFFTPDLAKLTESGRLIFIDMVKIVEAIEANQLDGSIHEKTIFFNYNVCGLQVATVSPIDGNVKSTHTVFGEMLQNALKGYTIAPELEMGIDLMERCGIRSVKELMSFPFMWTELETIQKLYILSNHLRDFGSCAPFEDALKKLKIRDWQFVLRKEIQMWKYEKAMVNKNLTLPKGNSGLLILVQNIIEHKIEYKMFQGWKSIPIYYYFLERFPKLTIAIHMGLMNFSK